VVLRVAVVNDHEIVVRGVVAMLRPHAGHVQVVDAAHRVPRIDVALYDPFSGDTDEPAILCRLLRAPHIDRVVVFTWNFQPWMAKDAIDRGAAGYLSKSLTGPQLVKALLEVGQGRVVVAPASEAHPREGASWPGRDDGLSAREAQVLTLITMGLGNAEIADRMDLSINSIKSYIRSCYRKIDAESRSQAVLWGVAHGLRTRPLDLPPTLDEAAPTPSAQRG
jgi:two-component system, NarL family, response regulator LiaR